MPDEPIFICRSEDLVEGGKGIRVPLTTSVGDGSGFAVRYRGVARGYVNRCAHVPIELDWMEGQFFESSGLYLRCATHGASYAPESGQCLGGPCRGGRLRPIVMIEQNGQVYWQPDQYVRPASQPSRQ
jgi:nitrite reductase/ring-hydroxylating ferredoxin subunit